MDIPRDLVEQFARENGIVFVGAGLSQGAGLPSWADLVRELAAELDGCPSEVDPCDIAQYYHNEYGRLRLVQRLRDWLDVPEVRPTLVHEALARLPVPAIFTTNYDSLLEQTLRAIGNPFATVIGNADASFWSADRLQVVKLHGDLNQPDSIIITAGDYERFAMQRPALVRLLAATLQTRTVLFLGYSATDPDLRLILTQVRDESGQFARNLYAVQFGTPRVQMIDLGQRGIKIIDLGEIIDADTRNAALLEWLQDFGRQIQLAIETRGLSQPSVAIKASSTVDIALTDSIPSSNSFFYGNPAPYDRFLDRRRESRRVIGRIINQGQSTAIVGEPRSGKTSMLLYLNAAETREKLYGTEGKRLLFNQMDAQTFGGEFSQALFWEYALRPILERVIAANPNSRLALAYQMCRENDFGAFVVERFLAQMKATRWRLILMLDEFDFLLYHPILNCAEFFGSLRSLASRSRGALALVIASRRSLADLNAATQQFSRAGSPYFNFLAEVTLGPLPSNAVKELLRWAGGRFTSEDIRLIVEMAGGHPYLLQVAASELWEAYTEFPDDRRQRWRQTGQRLYRVALQTLSDSWRLWSPAMRKAFTVVTLAEMSVLGQKKIRVKRLVRDLGNLGSELRTLREHGFIIEDENIPGGWQVRPQVFLWWLADDLATMARREMPFGEWLQRQEMGSLLAGAEKEQWGKAAQAAGVVFKEGVKVLVEATIQGFLSGVVTGV